LTSSERFALLAQYEGEQQQQQQHQQQQEQQLAVVPSPHQLLDPWTLAVNQLR